MESKRQHATAALGAGLPATGDGGHDTRGDGEVKAAKGARSCGVRFALSTSPRPRLRLVTNNAIAVGLTIQLGQEMDQATSSGFRSTLSDHSLVQILPAKTSRSANAKLRSK
jgi:hypothetical protein